MLLNKSSRSERGPGTGDTVAQWMEWRRRGRGQAVQMAYWDLLSSDSIGLTPEYVSIGKDHWCGTREHLEL